MKTNRDYYSWSQHNLFKSSKLSFYKRYVLGEEVYTPAFDKGKEFADYRETGEIPHFVDDPLLESVSNAIPRIGKSEYNFDIKFDEIRLYGFIDELKDDLTEFSEFKTGKNPWSESKAIDHDQLAFYAFVIYLMSGEKIIPKCKLYWIETQEVEVFGENKLMYTGHVEEFEVTFTEEDIENIAVDVYKTYQEIQEYVFEEVELEEDLVDRYIELLNESKKIDNEINIIKLKVLDQLNSTGAERGASSKGRFSISTRKTPIFSKQLIKKERDYKEEIKKLKNKEKKSKDCKFTETEVLLFKAIK